MGAFDDIQGKAEDAYSDIPPEQRQKIEQIAQEKGISLEQASDYVLRSATNGAARDKSERPIDPLAEEERNLE